jgi:hypothetical protein
MYTAEEDLPYTERGFVKGKGVSHDPNPFRLACQLPLSLSKRVNRPPEGPLDVFPRRLFGRLLGKAFQVCVLVGVLDSGSKA